MVDSSHEVILLALPGAELVEATAALKKRFPSYDIQYHSVQPPAGGRIGVQVAIPDRELHGQDHE